jgi:hypothetical protein
MCVGVSETCVVVCELDLLILDLGLKKKKKARDDKSTLFIVIVNFLFIIIFYLFLKY